MKSDPPATPTGILGDPTSASSPLDALPPAIPDHELLKKIGDGSYGEVWLARNAVGTLRAIKIVHRKTFWSDHPFEREFKGIQKFEPISRSHEGMVDVLQIGRGDGYFYYVMELADDASVAAGVPPAVEGGVSPPGLAPDTLQRANAKSSMPSDLSSPVPPGGTPGSTAGEDARRYIPRTLTTDLARHRRLPPAECIRIGLSLTDALAHLHRHGLVHRDIKPANIIFVGGVPKLADIGLVAEVSEARSYVGTEGFIPPEGPGTPQADLYSLGKLLYEISTGQDRHAFPALPSDLAEQTEVPQLVELNAILLKACQPDPRERYQSAEEMLAELELLREGQSVRRIRGHQRLWSRFRRAALGLVLLALVIGGIARLTRQTLPNKAAGDGPPSTNEMANALCTKGLLIIRGDNYASIADAYTNFHRAIQLDPNFARPYVGLFELRPWEEVPTLPPISADELRGIVTKLTELAPKLAVTYCAQSLVAWTELDYVKAKEYGLRAIRADPDCALAHAMYGFMLNGWGWPVEARKEIEAARRLAPSKVSFYRVLAHTYYMERDFPKAIAVYREALAWEPHHIRAYGCIAEASLAMGDYMTAISNDEQVPIILGTHDAISKAWYDGLRQAVTEQGALGYWRKQETRYAKEPDANFYDHAVCQMNLGNTNAALALLNRSYETHEASGGSSTPRIYVLLFDEVWDDVHDDPRFRALLDKIGYTTVMKQPRK